MQGLSSEITTLDPGSFGHFLGIGVPGKWCGSDGWLEREIPWAIM